MQGVELKAIILAGGYATRIRPISYYLNKHLFPVYNHPLIEYAIEQLVWADITDIAIVLGGSHPKQVRRYLGDGSKFGVDFTYVWQGAPRGIADAVNRVKDFCAKDKFIVHLGDNIVEDDLAQIIREFDKPSYECLVVLKEVENPRTFGVAEMKNGKLVGLEEKPLTPKSNLALVGIYGFNSYFFDLFKNLDPSWRGEYELTDILHGYIKKKREVLVRVLKKRWFSCDNFEMLLQASNFMFEQEQKRLKR